MDGMSALEVGMVSVVVVALVACVLPGLCDIATDTFVHKDDGHGRRLSDLMDARRRDGFSMEAINDEVYLRQEFVRLRVEASDAVAECPAEWRDRMHGAIEKAKRRVRSIRPDLVPAFMAMGRGLSYGHVLFDRECKLVDALPMDTSDLPRSDYATAALRTVRPN